jgi:hypothetical protein
MLPPTKRAKSAAWRWCDRACWDPLVPSVYIESEVVGTFSRSQPDVASTRGISDALLTLPAALIDACAPGMDAYHLFSTKQLSEALLRSASVSEINLLEGAEGDMGCFGSVVTGARPISSRHR